MEDGFEKRHPLVTAVFFVGCILFGVLFTHPYFLLTSAAMSLLYYCLLKGRKGLRFLTGMAAAFLAVALMNPFVNSQGGTVLFTYWGGRPFTLEALLYGIATGGMLVTAVLWFSCYHVIMTSDKLICLCGKWAPAISLVFCMVFRFVPNFKTKATAIETARRCVGKSPQSGVRSEHLCNAVTILSVLTSWALENGVVTADSMRSRGYGNGTRSIFQNYRFFSPDRMLICLMGILAAVIITCSATGGTAAEYFPQISFPAAELKTLIGAAAYTALLAIPSILHIQEELMWSFFQSRI